VPASGFEALAGKGAQARVEGRLVAVGGPRLLADMKVSALSESETWAGEGRTVLHVIENGVASGAIAIEDEIRPESGEAVAALHDLGLEVVMITGDSQS